MVFIHKLYYDQKHDIMTFDRDKNEENLVICDGQSNLIFYKLNSLHKYF